MRNAVLASTLLGAFALAVPATAASFTVTPGSIFGIPPFPSNDFSAQLAAKGLTHYTSSGASVSLSSPRKLKFEYMGSESGFTDTFTAGSLGPYQETNKAWGPMLIGYANFAGGAITNMSFSSSGGVVNSTIGTASFGIFIPRLAAQGTYSSNVLYFGFDDQLIGDDDNHDDFIVRVTAVPEPASWALLIAGFGLVGMTARRRSMKEVTS
jgi:hypothetical protein